MANFAHKRVTIRILEGAFESRPRSRSSLEINIFVGKMGEINK